MSTRKASDFEKFAKKRLQVLLQFANRGVDAWGDPLDPVKRARIGRRLSEVLESRNFADPVICPIKQICFCKKRSMLVDVL